MPLNIAHDRIAKRCVCCGSANLRRSPAVLMPFVAHRALGWAPVEIDESWGLATIHKGWAYSICNTLCCNDCGLLFLDIRFTESEMADLYHGYRGTEYTALRECYEPGYTARNDRLVDGYRYLELVEAFILAHAGRPSSILDWGGDSGKNTPFKASAEAIRVYDISDNPVQPYAHKVTAEEVRRFHHDLIVCSNVLEHVPYPGDVMAEIRGAMAADTVLYIEVPHEELIRKNGRDIQACCGKKRHWHEHINFFSEESLRRLVAESGYELLGMGEIDVSDGAGTSFVHALTCRRST